MEIFSHWSFLAATTILVALSRFASKRFTRARARAVYPKTPSGKLQRWFWHWGREYLDILPFVFGALFGVFWHDPLGLHWKMHEDIAFFVTAGAVAAFGGRTVMGAQKLKDEPTGD